MSSHEDCEKCKGDTYPETCSSISCPYGGPRKPPLMVATRNSGITTILATKMLTEEAIKKDVRKTPQKSQIMHACMMEIDPRYCQVIVNRWESYTGEKAVLVKNGENHVSSNSN